MPLSSDTLVIGDTGYQGLQRRHLNSLLPKKRRKKRPLTPEDKRTNRAIARRRMMVEHVIGRLKRFKILNDRYRNRRRRFTLRFNLIAAIHNFELP
jgi:hypothetical protein